MISMAHRTNVNYAGNNFIITVAIKINVNKTSFIHPFTYTAIQKKKKCRFFSMNANELQ